MEKITITRALSELKTLKSKYQKSISDLNLVAVKHGQVLRSPYNHVRVEDFEKKAKESLQSTQDLYKRYIDLKTAIDKSNSTTKIKIGGKDYTIQEALVLKSTIDMRDNFLYKIKQSYNSATSDYESALSDNEAQKERYASNIGSKNADQKSQLDLQKQAEDFINGAKPVSMINPCDIQKLIEKTENEIVEFKTNIDYALSESNSTTFIEV